MSERPDDGRPVGGGGEGGGGPSHAQWSVHVEGADLAPDELRALEAEAQRIVGAVVAPPSEDAILGTGARGAAAAPASPEVSVRLEITGVGAEAKDRIARELSSASRAILGKHLQGRALSALVCDQRPPGTEQNISVIAKMAWPPPVKNTDPYPGSTNRTYAVVGFWFKNSWGSVEDACRLIVEDGEIYWGTPDKDVAEIGLATRAPEDPNVGVDWDKAIAAFSPCHGMVQEIRSGKKNPTPVFMKLARNDGLQIQTVVLRKPKLFGWWTDMYHLHASQFWSVLGGKRATFLWLFD